MTMLNGFDATALKDLAEKVACDPTQASLEFSVRSHWDGGARSTARTTTFRFGERQHERDFVIAADTARELLGTDAAPNPQELLLAALNASMIIGLAAHATRAGIAIEGLEIATRGLLDLRRYLGLDPWLAPGYARVMQRIEVRSRASREQLQAVLDQVLASSPVLGSFGRALDVQTDLVVLAPSED